MAVATPCPTVAQWKEKIARPLTVEAEEDLARHLEACEQCASAVDQLLSKDTLSDVLRTGGTVADLPHGQTVETMIEKLRGLVMAGSKREDDATLPPNPTPSEVDAAPVAQPTRLQCPGCGKALKVKPELAGKKISCPGCKKTIDLPKAAKPAAAGQLQTAALDGLSKPAREKPAAELYDFLAPAQGPDEIGRLGGYRVLRVLGAGGMGVVFEAEDPKLKRPVALKAMRPALAASPSAAQRFLREAQSNAALKHDNIVTIYQVGEDRGVPFIAMEFLEGEPMDKRLEREPRLPAAETLRLGREIARGLAAAHKRGLIHRDIKPANIWLDAEGDRAKILDFGLARAASEESHLTQQGAIIGTPAYMAPEQAAGKPVDHRCDLFSLGCVLYRATAGKNPFIGTDTISTLMAVSMENPPAPKELGDTPESLSDLVMRLLEKKADDRPQTAQAVAEELTRIASDLGRAGGRQPPVDTLVANPAVTAMPAEEGHTTTPGRTPPGHTPGADAARLAISAKPRRWPLIAGGVALLALLAIAAPQIILRITGKDGKTQDVELKPGDKIEVLDKGQGTPAAPGNYALEFDGNAFVELAGAFDFGQDKPMTLEAWVKPMQIKNDVRNLVFSCDAKRAGSYVGVGIEWKKRHWMTSASKLVFSPDVAVLQRPVRLAVTSDGEKQYLFLDGKLQAAGDTFKNKITKLGLGQDFNGLIDDIRISSVCRYTADYTPGPPVKDKDTVALYHCDEGRGDVLTDSSGNGHHGKIEGATWVKVDAPPPVLATSRYRLEFNADSTVDVPTLTEPSKKLDWTMEGYVVLDEKSPSGRVLGFGDSLRFYYHGPEDKRGAAIGGGVTLIYDTGASSRVGPISVPRAKRVHLAAVHSSSGITFYLDGNNVGAGTGKRNTTKFQLGGGIVGSLSEVRISKSVRYDKDFTPPTRFEPDADTLALYHCDENSGDKLIDSSGNGHHGKIEGAKWVKVDAPPPVLASGSFTLEFEPSSKVNVPTVSIGMDSIVALTLEGYIVVRDNSPTGRLFGFGDDLYFAYIGPTPKGTNASLLSPGCYFQSAKTTSSRRGPVQIPFGRPVHIAAVRSSDLKYQFYVDGKSVGTPSGFPLRAATFMLGSGFSGSLREVRFSKSARYDKDFTPAQRLASDADTVALYHCDENSGDKLIDFSGNGHHGKIEGAKWVKVGETPSAIAPPTASGDFVPLFNGKDLTGWQTHPGQPGDWKVENGILVGRGPNKSRLYTVRKDYGDFHLRAEVKINSKGNSGLHLRVQEMNTGFPHCYEAQIDSDSHANKTGSLYLMAGTGNPVQSVPVRTSPVPPDTWFTHEVIAKGDTLIVKVDGKETAKMTDAKKTYERGYIAVDVFDAPTIVEFRKIEIREDTPPKSKVEAAPLPQPVPNALFNGKELDGFGVLPRNGWTIESGDIVGKQYAGKTTLATTADFGDYDLAFQVRYPEDAPNAITFTYRTGGKMGQPYALRFRADEIRVHSEVIFKLSPTTAKPRVNDFNDVSIRCVGKRVKIVVNGITLLEGELDIPPTGKLIWEGSPTGPVTIRNLRFTELK